MNTIKFNLKLKNCIIIATDAEENLGIAELISTEIEEISGGLMYIRKLPQITNSPDT